MVPKSMVLTSFLVAIPTQPRMGEEACCEGMTAGKTLRSVLFFDHTQFQNPSSLYTPKKVSESVTLCGMCVCLLGGGGKLLSQTFLCPST